MAGFQIIARAMDGHASITGKDNFYASKPVKGRGAACVENFDVITLTETWLGMSGKVINSEVKIDGHTVFHNDL